MQPLSIHLAKFDPQQLPLLLARPRLLDRLQRQPAKSVILIQGQAAQGKTSLAADFLRGRKTTVAWVSLHPGDEDVGSFCTLLNGALRQVCPFPVAFPALQSPMRPPAAETSDQWHRRLQQVWPVLPEDLEIVLDGLDRLSENAPSYALIRELCRESATRYRLWLLSRRTASFKPLHDCAGRYALTLDNTDLAFTQAETELYFRTFHRMTPTPEWIDHVHRLTDGWCGGLALISQAMANQSRDADGDVHEMLIKRLSGECFQFFGDDVFDALPASMRRFLLQAAAVDIIDPRLMSLLPSMQDCAALLENLVRNLGFIQSSFDEDGKRTLYRLNHLFHDFLRSRFAVELPAQEQRTLYDRMGKVYDDHGDLAAAVPYYLKAGNLQQAANCIKKVGISLVIKGQFGPLNAWFEQIRGDQIRSDPWLWLLFTLARRIKGQAKCVEDFQLIWEQFCVREDVRGQMITAAFLIEALVFQGREPGLILSWMHTGEQLLTVQGKRPYYAWAKLLLWLQIGFGYISGGMDLAKGLSAARTALLLAHKMGNDILTMQAAVVYSLGLIAGGEYKQAQRRLTGLAATPHPLPLLVYDVLRRLAGAEIDMRQGDLAAAEEKLTSVHDDIETHGLVFLYPSWVDATGCLQLAKRQYDEARLSCRHLIDVSVLAGNPLFKALARRLSSLIYYYGESYAQSAAEAARALEILNRKGPDTLYAMRVVQLQAMALHHLGKKEEALQLLTRSLDYFNATANTLAAAETHLMLALVHQDLKSPEATQTHLHQGLAMAAEGGFNPFIILSPTDQQSVCALAEKDDEKTCRRVSLTALADLAPDQSRDAAAGLAAIDWRNAAPGWLDIRTFGGFSVRRDGKDLITDRQWGGSRPKLLFKAFLVHGLREIPKDVIIDHLWPESSPQAAFQNFKVTLHRLRKTLEPDLNRNKSSLFIQLKDNLLSLNKDRCRVDLEEFLVCCKEIKRRTLNGELDSIATLGDHLIELYQGDFLPEEPYAPWVEMKRWALRDTYIDTILHVSAFYRDHSRPADAAKCCRAALQIDPFRESVIRELILLYTRLGRHKDARDVFEHYRSALKQDLGMEPDKEMLALMETIRR